jgi:hypothetical protein
MSAAMTDGGTPRHVPVFYCPYCAEEDIRPHEGGHGQWLCTGCRRVWAVRFIGLAAAGGAADPGSGAAGATATAGNPQAAATAASAGPVGVPGAAADPGGAR